MKYYKAAAAAALAVCMAFSAGCNKSGEEPAESEESFVEIDLTKVGDDYYDVTYDSDADSGSASKDSSSKKERAAKTNYKREADGEPIDIAWFDDCVFIGDSLTNGLCLYNDLTGCCGNAEFICGASIGWASAQWDLYDPNEVHPMYNGQKVRLEDCVSLTGANKVIIGLGMNDIGTYGIDQTFINADEFLNTLREKSGDVEIYIMTVTPMIESAERDILNNDLICQYNERLRTFAEEHSVGYLDTWSALVGYDGYLPMEYCQDPDQLGIHLTNDGCQVMWDYIMRHVGE